MRIKAKGLARHGLPGWVPEDVRVYLDHVECGRPIRALARDTGVHASTILRKVRKTENRRDDPLVDAGLSQLGRRLHPPGGGTETSDETAMATIHSLDDMTPAQPGGTPDDGTLERDALRILRALAQPDAVMAVAPEVAMAVVVREASDGRPRQLATVMRESAEAMALKGWITCDPGRRVLRYRISAEGRRALNRLLAASETARAGFSEASGVFAGARGAGVGDGPFAAGNRLPGSGTAGSRRSAGMETPLRVLARRRDRTGRPYLSPDLVARRNG